MKELRMMRYDSQPVSLDQHMTTICGKKDHLSQIGVQLPDNVFAIILSNLVPQGFPNTVNQFESCLLLDKRQVVGSSNVTKVMGAADVTHQHVVAGTKVMKVWRKPCGAGTLTEGRTCFWCDITGHTICDCRKKRNTQGQKCLVWVPRVTQIW